MDPVRGRTPRKTESISKLLLSIWKKSIFRDFQVLAFLGRGEGVSKECPKDVSREKIDL